MQARTKNGSARKIQYPGGRMRIACRVMSFTVGWTAGCRGSFANTAGSSATGVRLGSASESLVSRDLKGVSRSFARWMERASVGGSASGEFSASLRGTLTV
jgi:hypothetical protein